MLYVQSRNTRDTLTKNIQLLLTTPCTHHAFHWGTLDVHDFPDPFSRMHEGGWAQDYNNYNYMAEEVGHDFHGMGI